MLKNSIRITCLSIIVMLCLTGQVFSGNNMITVFTEKETGRVDRRIFGTSFLGYDAALHKPKSGHSYAYTDYGAGVWNPAENRSVDKVIDLAKEIGISYVRFPGGCGTHFYEWKNTIGDNRKHYLFGLDEFLRSVKEIGAEPVLTISYFTNSETDAAELVEYLNAPNNGESLWARKRAENGQEEPYGVRYFEFGNEVWHGNHLDKTMKNGQFAVKPEEYAQRYLSFRDAMKKVDSSIQLGLILHSYREEWNNRVIRKVGADADFLDVHIYPPHDLGFYNSYKKFDTKDLFRVVLGSIGTHSNNFFRKYASLFKSTTGRDDVSFAVNEFNGGFVQEKPVPYRHSLGNALVISELLRIFLEPTNRVFMASYWHFSNSYWGMVFTDDNYQVSRNNVTYRKRPNFYVYKLYNDHFGNILLDTNVTGESYDIGIYKPYMAKLRKRKKASVDLKDKILNKIKTLHGDEDEHASMDTRVPHLSVSASKSDSGDKVFLIIVNKNLDDKVRTHISLSDFAADDEAVMRVLNGPSVDATNEDSETVTIREEMLKIEGSPFEVVLEPHSVTAIEIKKKR